MLEKIFELIKKGYGYVESSMWGDCPAEYGEDAILSIKCGLEDDEESVKWSIDDEHKVVVGYWTQEDY